MEGYDWSPNAVQELVRVHQGLLGIEIHNFMQYIRDDRHLSESLGLYRAYTLADEWAQANVRPREFEVRALHELVVADLASAGRYKTSMNEIGGSEHVPTAPWDVAPQMDEMMKWFARGSGDPVLDAAVVHAWLTHIHPFDDGNGRMARLLANLALVQSRFPPLLLQSGADRGEYLDALAASDNGDILPLYELFVRTLRRTIKVMEQPDYVRSVVEDRLLSSVAQRCALWQRMVARFAAALARAVRTRGWRVELMGAPGVVEFKMLEERNPDGSCWFVKIRDPRGRDLWLLWFGFRSDKMLEIVGRAETQWPSIYVSRRSRDPESRHVWDQLEGAGYGQRPSEIALTPSDNRPALLRWGWMSEAATLTEAAGFLAASLCAKDGR
jgi:hypothetical protein